MARPTGIANQEHPGIELSAGARLHKLGEVALTGARQRAEPARCRSLAGIDQHEFGVIDRLDTLVDGLQITDYKRKRLPDKPSVDRISLAQRKVFRINTSSVDRVSAVLDFDDKGVEGALRVSPHYYNTDEELDAFYKKVLPGQALINNKTRGITEVSFQGSLVLPIIHRAEVMEISLKTIELERRGTVSLRGFYARRFRRLLPAGTLVKRIASGSR